ncbi:MAG: gamma-glutamylcyclotransferase family protein [Nitrospirales bacterium]|nr:gamma-glutamylcyclotransferase family protein [Nitrospirales bacterium]
MHIFSIFTYGTLEIPAVMEAVTGKVFESAAALADGYARYLLKGKVYPGITPLAGQTTSGRVYFNVSQEAVTLLDRFEDNIYVPQVITVRTDSGQRHNAYAYIIEPKDQGVLSMNPWIRETFIETSLNSYLEACRQFHSTYCRALSSGISIG